MSHIIDLSDFLSVQTRPLWTGSPLRHIWEQVRARIARLDEEEPEPMGSEAHEAWGEQREELEDLADELMDRLDELGGADVRARVLQAGDLFARVPF